MTGTTERLTVVWFKRDLRLADHRPLSHAAASGPVLPLHVVEPAYWALPDTSWRQWAFLHGCLGELATDIEERGGRLSVHVGSAVEALDRIRDRHGPFDLVSHMETGNAWTYRRDRAVAAWCRSNGVSWSEHRQYGVLRGADVTRDRWASRWDAQMSEPILPVPERIGWVEGDGEMPDAAAIGLPHDGIAALQAPGRKAGLALLESFLHVRGEPYTRAMSSPVTGEAACSRLSPHLMAGTLSMKEIYQATLARQAEIADRPKDRRGTWPSALKSFVGRLHWHCHFMQKLETEPEIEWLPMARAYDGLRPEPTDEALLTAFAQGRTGYPFVDACMRSLGATGWINFRMRAMLMSFASYDLWLPWQMSGAVLARLFTDYEPGIHWPQSQMQSGETGINAVRIYSPVKQGHDQDPDGAFTRRWVPELAHLDGKALQEPWTLPALPNGYPDRIVDHLAASRTAKERIAALRRTQAARTEANEVFDRHGSRKPRLQGTTGRSRT